jgi:hypothetical protein
MRFDNNEYAAGYRIEAAYFTGDNRGANAFLFSSNESGRSSARFDFVNGLLGWLPIGFLREKTALPIIDRAVS